MRASTKKPDVNNESDIKTAVELLVMVANDDTTIDMTKKIISNVETRHYITALMLSFAAFNGQQDMLELILKQYVYNKETYDSKKENRKTIQMQHLYCIIKFAIMGQKDALALQYAKQYKAVCDEFLADQELNNPIRAMFMISLFDFAIEDGCKNTVKWLASKQCYNHEADIMLAVIRAGKVSYYSCYISEIVESLLTIVEQNEKVKRCFDISKLFEIIANDIWITAKIDVAYSCFFKCNHITITPTIYDNIYAMKPRTPQDNEKLAKMKAKINQVFENTEIAEAEHEEVE
jgi:hypothetical protein